MTAKFIPNSFGIISAVSRPPILLGTSSFTAAGWEGSFYPKGMRSTDYLAFYAEHFHTVEVDSTFYGCPSARTVANWNARTPEGFLFSVKVPQTITHEKVLLDCDAALQEFFMAMDLLGQKLGPMVFQFPFFNRSVFRDRHEFLDRLIPFLKKLPHAYQFAIEIRNRDWLDAELANLLRDHRIALVLQDRFWMPRSDPEGRGRSCDPAGDWQAPRQANPDCESRWRIDRRAATSSEMGSACPEIHAGPETRCG